MVSKAPDCSPEATKSQYKSSKNRGCSRKQSDNGIPEASLVPISPRSFFTLPLLWPWAIISMV